MFRLLHIIAVIFAVGMALGPELLVHRLLHSGDVRTIRSTVKFAVPLGKLVPPLFVTAAVMGLAAAHAGSFNYLAPWLIASYVIFIGMIVLGAAFHDPWVKRIGIAAQASPDDRFSPELQEAINTPKGGQLITYLSPFAILIMILLMVLKPGGN